MTTTDQNEHPLSNNHPLPNEGTFMAHDIPDMKEAGSVESVIHALQKVIALLDRIKNTIEESSGKIPKAAVQLDTVTKATEMATVEILNVLDTMTQKIAAAEQGLDQLKQRATGGDDLKTIEGISGSLRDVKEDTLNITMALQVQDITAQKIAAANHLIESVRKELLHELNHFQSAAVESLPKHAAAMAASFDKNASYVKSEQHQEQIDKVVLEWKEKQSSNR